MKPFKPYIIPNIFNELELCKNMDITHFKNLVEKSKYDIDSYISLFTIMLYMEEAACSTHLRKFDLKNIQLILHSSDSQVYKIKYNVCV